MKNAQASLFGVVPQPRLVRRRESLDLYLAVLVLRRRGHRVYRAGRRQHLVDGRRVFGEKRIVAMAEKVGR